MATSPRIPIRAFRAALAKLGVRPLATRSIECEGRPGQVFVIRAPRTRKGFIDAIVEKTSRLRGFVYVVQSGEPKYIGRVPLWARHRVKTSDLIFVILLSGQRPPSYRARLLLQGQAAHPNGWWLAKRRIERMPEGNTP